MGWIFGIIGKYSESDEQTFNKIHSNPLHIKKQNSIYLAAGGIKETCLCGNFNDLSTEYSGWVISGVGINFWNDQFSFMTQKDWAEVLVNKNPVLQNLDGHFVAVKWKENKAICFTDQLGLRNLYLLQNKYFTAFSTRLDWLSKLSDKCDIDLETFGERWLLINQLSYNSILKNTKRLTQGGIAVCTPQGISVQNNLWNPDTENYSKNESFSNLLDKLSCFPMLEGKKISLGLSGGLDSRVLLSLLTSSNSDNWCLHSVGFPNDPDLQIAKKISAELTTEHLFIRPEIPNQKECFKQLYEYVGQTLGCLLSSNFLKLNYYSLLYNQNKIVIDGGQGEIARRELFNRLFLFGKKFILNGSLEKIYPFVASHRASFFKTEVLAIMRNGAVSAIKELKEKLPPVKEIGIERWLDYFILRCRFPNLTNIEQSRSDSEFVNYMPFAQPSVIGKIFEIPVDEIYNGKLLKKIIKEKDKRLLKYPRVKNGIYMPFNLSTFSARVWLKVKGKLGRQYHNPLPLKLLENMSEFVQDTVNS